MATTDAAEERTGVDLNLDGIDHIRGSDRCCGVYPRRCSRCNGRIHYQGGFLGMIVVCEDCGLD